MQNNRNSYRRKDRRDDAQTQESSTSYRPRTRRKNDAYMSRETREGRREQHRDRNQYSEASGSYRPRTIRKGYVEGADRRSTPSREREREQEYEYSIGTLGEEIQDITTRESGADRSRDTRRVRSHNSSELRRKRYEDNSSVDNRERRNTNSRKERSGARERNQEFFESSSRRTREEYVREERGGREVRKRREEVRRNPRLDLEYRSHASNQRLESGRRQRINRFDNKVGSASPTGGGARRTRENPDYFAGLDALTTTRDVRRTTKEPKGGDKRNGIRGRRNEAASFSHKREATVYMPIDLSHPMRLNRYIAHCGQCSRRDADLMITAGEITVNGEVVTTLGEKVVPAKDVVLHNGQVLNLEQKVYILLNKPKDTVCTVEDEHAGRTVLDIIAEACTERVYPVGRLDRNTTGLLLLTNDGDLTEKLTHPSYAKRKTYEVTLDRKVTPQDMERLYSGVELDDGTQVRVDEVAYVLPDDARTVGVTIHTGQNRVVRRMFDALGFRVERLDRVLYAGLTKRNLPRGKWRFLTEEEVRMLKNDTYK